VVRVGEDLFRAYIDVDTAGSAGTMSLGVRADYRVDVTGIYGRIASKTAYQWSGTAWVVSSRTVTVANDRSRIEASLDLAGVTTGTMAMAIVASDWRLLSDATDVYSFLNGPAGGTRGASPPVTFDINGNSKFWFHNTNHGTETACTHNKVADATPGSALATLALAATESVCWYVDPTAGLTIHAGDWETLLDISSGGAGAAYDVKLEIWNLDSNDVAQTIASCTGVTTFGNDIQCLATSVPEKILTGTQVVRMYIQNTGSGATVTVSYDDSTSSGDSRATLPLPEFHEILLPIAVVGVIYFVARRRRRDADS
jgi:hypothetical protein